jgi:transcriptional regulator with XRE-family HTH domain
MELHRRFGRNVKSMRKAAGFTQDAFADLAGLTRSYMSDIENARRNPTLMVVAKIAKALNVSPSSLLD